MPEISKVWFKDDNRALASYGNTICQIWRGTDTFARYRGEVGAILRQLVTTYPDGVCGLMLVEETAAMPRESARKEVSEIWHAYQGKIEASALVIAGDGVRAAAVRAAAMTVTMMTRRKEPFKHFAEPRAAVQWLSTSSKNTTLRQAVNEVTDFIESLRKPS